VFGHRLFGECAEQDIVNITLDKTLTISAKHRMVVRVAVEDFRSVS
jgi:hypothetical protein